MPIKINLNTTELWPIWIAFFWYIGLIIVRVSWDKGPIKFPTWNGYDLILFFNDFSNITGILCNWFITIGCIVTSSIFLKKKLSYSFYCILFILTFVSQIIGSFKPIKEIGLGTSIFCILFGYLCRTILGNTITDYQISKNLSLEFFIKISIVLLAINIEQIFSLGPKGLFIAWVETCILLISSFLFGRYILRLTKEESILISGGLSICGSSAIMAISDIVSAHTKTIVTSITIISVFTIPFIPTLPLLAKSLFNLKDITVGAWIGGSIDSTGAVIASSSLINTKVLYTAVIIKMLQNILIGPITLVITSIWHKTTKIQLLWKHFPKFVLGFFIVCGITSALPNPLQNNIITDSLVVSEWFSNISFVLVGMEINTNIFFENDVNTINDTNNNNTSTNSNVKMIVLYLLFQTIDVVTTLGSSYLMYEIL